MCNLIYNCSCERTDESENWIFGFCSILSTMWEPSKTITKPWYYSFQSEFRCVELCGITGGAIYISKLENLIRILFKLQSIIWCIFSSIFWCIFSSIFWCILSSIFWCIFSSIFWCIFSSIFWCIFSSIFWCIFSSIFWSIFSNIFWCIFSSIFLCIFSSIFRCVW